MKLLCGTDPGKVTKSMVVVLLCFCLVFRSESVEHALLAPMLSVMYLIYHKLNAVDILKWRNKQNTSCTYIFYIILIYNTYL